MTKKAEAVALALSLTTLVMKEAQIAELEFFAGVLKVVKGSLDIITRLTLKRKAQMI